MRKNFIYVLFALAIFAFILGTHWLIDVGLNQLGYVTTLLIFALAYGIALEGIKHINRKTTKDNGNS